MGRVRTKTVKKSAKLMVEKYYSRLTLDFQTNKKVCDEIAILPSKRVRNKIAGFITVSIDKLSEQFLCGFAQPVNPRLTLMTLASYETYPERTSKRNLLEATRRRA